MHRRRAFQRRILWALTACVIGLAAVGCGATDEDTGLSAASTVDVRSSESTPSPRPEGTPTAEPQQASDFLETTSEVPILVPTQPRGRADDDALVSGILTLTGRCLWIVPGPLQGGYVIIWPEGTRVTVLDGQIAVVKSNGDVFARAGDVVALGGGEWGGASPEGCGGPAWGADF